MKLTISESYLVDYQVCAFEAMEGGMGYQEHGNAVDTLQEAILALREAHVKDTSQDWIITVNVTKV